MSGRKRLVVVDTLGLLLAVVVHPANIQDRDGAKLVLTKLAGRFPHLRLLWADGAYAGALLVWALVVGGWVIELVKKPEGATTFAALPKPWIVERTCAWLGWCRLSNDGEALSNTSETRTHLAMLHLMLKRLAPR